MSLADQPDAAERCADLYGPRVGIVPYIMPGFLLAKAAAEVFEEDPAVEGLVLIKHGVFSFGETAREAYERMIAIVSLAEERLAQGRKKMFVPAKLPAALAGAAEIAPILRGICALPDPAIPGNYKRFILDFRGGPAILDFVNGAELPRYGRAGVATPDHTIRTKNYPLIVPPPERGHQGEFATAARDALGQFIADYHAYFARHNAASAVKRRELDAIPRVILVPGLGLFGLGHSAKEAAVAADLAESWVATVTDAEAVGTYESLNEAELFGIEYWPLEQAKLGTAGENPLAGQVAVVTGGAGTIGLATARALRGAGAEIALFDREGTDLKGAAQSLGGFGMVCDVTEPRRGGSRLRPRRPALRRGRYRRLQCRRGVAGPDRRGLRGAAAREFRTQFLRSSSGCAIRGPGDAGARHRRRVAVQCIETGGQSRARFRTLRHAQGGHSRADAPVRARIRRRRHPRQRGQRRRHPRRPVDR